MNIQGMRIALFTGAYNHIADGVSRTLNRLVDHLELEGASVRVYAPTIPDPPVKHRGTLVPVPSVSAPGRPEYRVSLGLSGDARLDLTRFAPHLFHIATPDMLGVAALLAAVRSGTPVVASYHTHFASYLDYYRLGVLKPITWSYLRWFYRHCRQIYVPTYSMMEVLRQKGISENLMLWPRGVDSVMFTPGRRSVEWRQRFGVGDDDVVVAFVSRLVTEKGLDVLIDVINGLKTRGIAHRSLIVGDGPERGRLDRALSDAILTGHLEGEELATAYASSDVFLFPSETETFGNVTLEALASGLPAVVANATGSNSLVENGVTGFLATPRDSGEFLEKTLSLVEEAALRQRMSAAARQTAKSYDWNRVLGQIVSYYEKIER